jgi:SAM-dependent MidA family methyltransferase
MATQKITVHVDQALLQRARKRTGKGVSDTIRQGLTLVAAGAAYQKLRALRGRVKFSADLRRLREDRS